MPRRPARLLEVEQAALASHVTSCGLLFVVPLFVSLVAPWSAGGGRQGGCGLELCVRQLRVCGSQLAVCLVSLFCVARACRHQPHHLSSVHPYRVSVQSEPGCSSYLASYLT